MIAASHVASSVFATVLVLTALLTRRRLAELRRAHTVAQRTLSTWWGLQHRRNAPPTQAGPACTARPYPTRARYRRNQARPHGNRLNRSGR